MQKYLLGLNYWVIGGFSGATPIMQAIDMVADMGLDCLELTFGDVLKENITLEECNSIVEHAKKQKIRLETLSSGTYWNQSLSSQDESERNRAVQFTKKYIKTASCLGIKKILIVPGAVDVGWDDKRPVTSYKKVWETSTQSINEIIPTAEKYNVILGLENVWNKFLLSPMEWKFYLDQFDSPFVGIYFDAGNVLINGYPEHWIELLSEKIVAIQVKNFKRENAAGTLLGFTDDFESGALDFIAFVKCLKKAVFPMAGGTCPIIAEMLPFCRLPDMRLPDTELAKDTATKMRKLFLELELRA